MRRVCTTAVPGRALHDGQAHRVRTGRCGCVSKASARPTASICGGMSATSTTSGWSDDPGDDPAVGRDRPGPCETVVLEDGHRAGVQERTRHRTVVGLLGIAFGRATTLTGDLGQRTAESGVSDAALAQTLPGEEAGDAPVRQRREVLFVLPSALDLRQLGRRAELAPAQAVVTFEDERSMGAALTDSLLLLGPVLLGGTPLPDLDMEAHAPATAPHTVIRLDQSGERGPGVRVQWPDGEGGNGCFACCVAAHGRLPGGCTETSVDPTDSRPLGQRPEARLGAIGACKHATMSIPSNRGDLPMQPAPHRGWPSSRFRSRSGS